MSRAKHNPEPARRRRSQGVDRLGELRGAQRPGVTQSIAGAREKSLQRLPVIDREIFLSVECGTINEAERSLAFLEKILAK